MAEAVGRRQPQVERAQRAAQTARLDWVAADRVVVVVVPTAEAPDWVPWLKRVIRLGVRMLRLRRCVSAAVQRARWAEGDAPGRFR